MLDVNTVEPAAQRPRVSHRDGHDLLELCRNLVARQWRVVVGIAAAVVGAALLFCLLVAPRFGATASVLIDGRKLNVFQQQSPIGDAVVDPGMIDSQVEILRSDWVAALVVRRLDLLNDPELNEPPGLVGTARAWLRSLYAAPEPPPSEADRIRRLAERLRGDLTVRRVGQSYVLEVSYQSLRPARAAEVANAVAETYISDQLQSRFDMAKRTSGWLEDRIKELGDQSGKAAGTLLEYKAKNNIVETNGRTILEQQLSELTTQLGVARVAADGLKARLDRIENVLRGDVGKADLPDVRSEVVTRLRQQYVDLAARESSLAARVGAEHEATVAVRNQIAETNAALAGEYRRLAESARSDYEIAKARVESAQANLAAFVTQSQRAGEAQVALRELESSAQTARTLHDTFLRRLMESMQQQSFPITEARIVSPATPPLMKSFPRTTLILLGAAFVGGALGLGAGVLREVADRTLKSGDEVERTLGLRALGTMPEIGETLPTTRLGRIGAAVKLSPTAPDDPARLTHHVLQEPHSHFAEAVRAIKVALVLAGVEKPANVIGVTSTIPDEGKSTVAANLAHLLGRNGQTVLLVDGDLRKPNLSRLLAPASRAGLLQLSGGVPLADALKTLAPSPHVSFLPAGSAESLAQPRAVADLKIAETILEAARTQFDYVVVDLPPLAPVIDVRAAAEMIDAFVYVVRWGATPAQLAANALEASPGVADKVLGVVLNRADPAKIGLYDRLYGSYQDYVGHA